MIVKEAKVINPETEASRLLHVSLRTLLLELSKDGLKYNVNRSDDMQCIGYRWIKTVFITGKLATFQQAYQLMKSEWKIKSSDDLVTFFKVYGCKLKKLGFHMETLIAYTNKGKGNTRPKCKYNQSVKEIRQQSAVKDQKRAVVCRSRTGMYGYKIYEIEGSITTSRGSMMNMVKKQFSIDTGCPYYDVRPVLMSTWVRLSPEEQIATN